MSERLTKSGKRLLDPMERIFRGVIWLMTAALPVALPFIFISEAARALRISNAIAVTMQYPAGNGFLFAPGTWSQGGRNVACRDASMASSTPYGCVTGLLQAVNDHKRAKAVQYLDTKLPEAQAEELESS
jgi:hypothetical protein